VSHGPRYWQDQPDTPFATLLTVISAYCEPEADAYEELVEAARTPGMDSRMPRFKTELREAIADPGRIPDEHALSAAASHEDGSDRAFLRRLWRDLYPNEPVPGGDDEFREDLRKVIRGEVSPMPSTVWVYRFRYSVEAQRDGNAAFGRRIWQDLYPDEPAP
jgi:hypothetical protein